MQIAEHYQARCLVERPVNEWDFKLPPVEEAIAEEPITEKPVAEKSSTEEPQE